MNHPRVAPRRLLVSVAVALFLSACSAASASRQGEIIPQRDDPLAARLSELAALTPGSLGACVISHASTSCVNGDRAYSMQSVMKLLVALATFDAADRGLLRLHDPMLVKREDLSLYVQPIAKLVTEDGFHTTIEDLVLRAVVDSDSAATDILLRRLGGPRAVQRVLRRMEIDGVRIDRDERHLQTEIVGLTWRPEFTDPAVLQRAIDAVPLARRRQANRRYITDVRDTATPRGMALLLHRLAAGELLSSKSTERLLAIMRETRTFPQRLRAGAPAGWAVGHKTGSSGSFDGVTTATNDVGVYFPPSGRPIAVAVFLASSPASAEERNAAIAAVGTVAAAYRGPAPGG